MEPLELLNLMDQVRDRVRVTHQEAKEALERNEYNVVEAILELERSPGQAAQEFSRKTKDFVMDPAVTLRRHGRELLKVPAVAAAGAVLLGLVKPKFLVLSLAALLVSGTDIQVSYDDKEVSLHETFKNRSGKAAANVADMKDKLDDRFHNMKEWGFHKDTREPGLSYFTVKL